MSDSLFNSGGWRERLSLRRSARARRIRLRIDPSGIVEVVVPKGFNAKYLPPLLDRHEEWVVQTLERLGVEARLHRVEAPGQIELPAIGKVWQIVYLDEDGGRYGCREKGEGTLQVSGGTHWQAAIRRWLIRKGQEHLVPWLEQVSRETGLSYNGVSIRLQRSRWGSCTVRQRINLNAALLFLPPEQVRYLLVHELSHTLHMNHSSAYWKTVAGHEPDYRILDRGLRKAARQLPNWLHASLVVPANEG
jgi:predicted metal-dependent hydrolase